MEKNQDQMQAQWREEERASAISTPLPKKTADAIDSWLLNATKQLEEKKENRKREVCSVGHGIVWFNGEGCYCCWYDKNGWPHETTSRILGKS